MFDKLKKQTDYSSENHKSKQSSLTGMMNWFARVTGVVVVAVVVVGSR